MMPPILETNVYLKCTDYYKPLVQLQKSKLMIVKLLRKGGEQNHKDSDHLSKNHLNKMKKNRKASCLITLIILFDTFIGNHPLSTASPWPKFITF